MSCLNWREQENKELLREGKEIIEWEKECEAVKCCRKEWVSHPIIYSFITGISIIFSFIYPYVFPIFLVALGAFGWIDWIKTKKLFPFPEYQLPEPKQIELRVNPLKEIEDWVFDGLPPPRLKYDGY